MDDECNEYTSSEEQVRYARELKPNHYDSGVVKMIAIGHLHKKLTFLALYSKLRSSSVGTSLLFKTKMDTGKRSSLAVVAQYPFHYHQPS